MRSPSAKAYAQGVRQAEAFERDLQRCRHPQAEPVILSTGELVACVCIGCYQQLPADYIEGQAEQAHRAAYSWLTLRTPNELRTDAGFPPA